MIYLTLKSKGEKMKPSKTEIKKVMGYMGRIKTAKKTASSRKNAAKAAAARRKEEAK